MNLYIALSWCISKTRRCGPCVARGSHCLTCHLHTNVKICVHTKFRWNISISDRVITTPGFGKRTSAVLEFYFRFRFWPTCIHRHRHGNLHRHTKVHPNRSTHGGLMTSYLFFWRPCGVSNLLPTADLVTALVWEGRNLSNFWCDISIHGWVDFHRFYRFVWFPPFLSEFFKLPPVWENKRPPYKILLPVYNLTIHVTLACCRLYSTKFGRHMIILAKVISIYLTFNMATVAILDLQYTVSRPQRSRFGPKNSRKFWLNRLASFRDMWIFHFSRLCLKMPIPAHFGEFFRGLTP